MSSSTRDLFGNENEIKGADFSDCRKYRYALWRIWDKSKPFVMFIGLNPSTANENTDDATIRRVKTIAANLGYGGVYMMNCFPFVTAYPSELLNGINPDTQETNWRCLQDVGRKCSDIVFAWGNFKEVEPQMVNILRTLFPSAKALHINKNGSPKHPLYCKSNTIPTTYINKTKDNG